MMRKKDYMKPTMRTIQLHYRQQILTGSIKGIQTKHVASDSDPGGDDPIYDGTSSGNLWDAN